MWRKICRIFKPGAKWSFQKADFKEYTDKLKNAARGWYQIYTFSIEETPSFQKFFWCGNDDDTIAMLIVNIGEYREGPISDEALEHMRKILSFFSSAGYDIVLRVVYDHEGKALEKEPFFFSQVTDHIMQIMPIVNEFAASVFIFQGMLIGNWGEMHTSRFLAPAKLKAIWKLIKEELKDGIFCAVRRPAHWRILHPEGCGRMELPYDNMGLFDDAILSTETHMGTFGSTDKENSGWDNLWSRKDELEFEERLCLRVPNGGEVVCGEGYSCESDMQEVVETLRKMHITYLNKYYDKKILDIWKQVAWQGNDAWKGRSVYDYIENHLGYRFLIKDVTLTVSEEHENSILVSIDIENTGFANYYQEAEVFLVMRDEVTCRGKNHRISCDIRNWDAGSTQTITCEIEAENGSLYLEARRMKDKKKIYFANEHGCKTGKYFLGKISYVRLR